MKSPVEFIGEVRQETRKVTWPTRRETVLTTFVVVILVVAVSLLLVGADTLMATAVNFILRQGK